MSVTQETVSFEEELNRSGHLVYTNKGVSMMPLLRQGKDLMLICKRPEERLKKFDAVLFKRYNGQYVLHRILKVRENDYFIAGDNCFSGEDVNEEQILGILTGVIRSGKTIHTDDFRYRLYVHIWCDLYPVRFFILKILNRLRSLARGVCRRLFPSKKRK